MPCAHTVTPWEESLFQQCAKSKNVCGFDGLFSLPDEQRIWLEAASEGARVELMRIIKHLKLSDDDARALFFGRMQQPEPASVQEVETFFQELLMPRRAKP